MLYNDGMECRVYRPVAGTLNILDEFNNTPMGNFVLSHSYPHKPRPGQSIAKVTEDDLDNVIDGYTRPSKVGTGRGAHDNRNKGKQRVLEHAKQNDLSRERPKRD